MLAQYFKHAKRTLIRNRYYAILNVIGLVCGMLTALIIAVYIASSLSADTFHENRERIYSVTHDEIVEGRHQSGGSSTYSGVGEVAAQFSTTARITRYSFHVPSAVSFDGLDGKRHSFVEKKIFFADSSFLKVFSFRMVSGNLNTALSQENSIVLTRSIAKKFFGDVDPTGRSVTVTVPWGAQKMYTITGVLEDVPKRSQFQYNVLVSQDKPTEDGRWKAPDCSLFLHLNNDETAEALEAKLNTRLSELGELKSNGRQMTVFLLPLGKIVWSGSEYLLAALGIFILLTCWINYINQTIAQTYGRIKEVGIMRVTGATRRDLQQQFIIESAIVCMIAFAVVLLIYAFTTPWLQTFTGGRMMGLTEIPAIGVAFVAVLLTGISVTAGIPTAILFSQNFGAALQSLHNTKIGGVTVRKALVIFQFSISVVLLNSIFVISGQLDYVLRKEKGFNTDGVLVVEAPMLTAPGWTEKRKNLQHFKQRCSGLPFVIDVTSSTTVPGEEYRQETYLSLRGDNFRTLIHQCGVDENFFSLYGMTFVAGRDFIPDAMAKNRSSIVLNESAARALGISDFDAAINTTIVDHEEPATEYDLIGIVRDFHQTALRYQMKPMAFKFQIIRGHISLKTNEQALIDLGIEKGIASIKELFSESYPDASFSTYFLRDQFASEYSEEQNYRKIFEYFTVISMVLSSLGLFGLSLLISTKRQKEIGIRKTFGASSASILVIFLKGYLAQLGIAVIIGCPAAYVLMNAWLKGYAYRIDIGFGLISMAVVSLTIVFLLTISFHTIKASMSSPHRILRS